jgi:hypothetical protein
VPIDAQTAARRLRVRTVGDVLSRIRIRPSSPVAASAAALLMLAAVACSLPCAAARAATWARPVLGRVTSGFDYRGSPFAAGLHRGVDLVARPGAAVGAPCSGRVVVAGRVGTSGRVVTVACGPWRASVLPLASVAVRRGAHVRAGRFVGVAAGERGGGEHAGLHLGVRRASDRFGYVDPLRFLPRGHPWRPVAPLVGRRRGGRRAPTAPMPAAAPLTAAASGPAAAAPTGGRRPVAPWPVWAGVALMLAGAASGGILRARSRRAVRLGRLAPRTSNQAGYGGEG